MLRSVLHYAGVDQLGIAGEGDGFVGVMHHQVAALDPDRDVPSLFTEAVGHRRHHRGTGAGAAGQRLTAAPLPGRTALGGPYFS